jgi:hypothetical protein
MAQVFGEPGRNAAEQSFKQTKRVLMIAMCSIGALTALAGYALSGVLPIPKFSLTATALVLGIMALLMWLIGKWGTDRIDHRPAMDGLANLESRIGANLISWWPCDRPFPGPQKHQHNLGLD